MTAARRHVVLDTVIRGLPMSIIGGALIALLPCILVPGPPLMPCLLYLLALVGGIVYDIRRGLRMELNHNIYIDADGDPRIVIGDEPRGEDWRVLTWTDFASKEDALDFIRSRHPELIVDALALDWWNTGSCLSDDSTNPMFRLSGYRQDQGGIGTLCPVADTCPLLNDHRACHGIVYCNVYNGGWGWAQGSGPRDDTPGLRRERLLALLAEAERARRYREKGLG